MVNYITILCLATLFLSCGSKLDYDNFQSQEEQDKIEIPIEVKVTEKTFPEDWKSEEIKAKGEDLADSEVSRSLKIIKKALKKYPEEVLKQNLVKIYVLKRIEFFGVGYGGTNSNDIVYVTNNGISEGYTDEYLEKTFHHEFSSILLRNYPDLFPEEKWKAINSADYQYKSGGVEAIRSNAAGTDFSDELMKQGFLYQYAMTDIENDVNSFAENIFCQKEDYKSFVLKYPKIKQKQDLIIEFYQKVNENFSKEFFEGNGK